MRGRLAWEATVLVGSACGVTVVGIWLTNLPPAVVLALATCAGAAMLLTRPFRNRSATPAPTRLYVVRQDGPNYPDCAERSNPVPPTERPR